MGNTEIKVGDLVGWVDRVEGYTGGAHSGLVVHAEVVRVDNGRDLPFRRRVYWVRWLNGPRRGDTALAWCGKYLALLSDPKNKKQTA